MKLILEKNQKDLVIVRVEFENDIDRISNTGFNGDEALITVSKGKSHTLKVFDKDMKKLTSFDFGANGYTLISDDLSILKQKVLTFIKQQRINIKVLSDQIKRDIKIMYFEQIPNQVTVHIGGQFFAHYKSVEEVKLKLGNYEVTKDGYSPATGCKLIEGILL